MKRGLQVYLEVLSSRCKSWPQGPYFGATKKTKLGKNSGFEHFLPKALTMLPWNLVNRHIKCIFKFMSITAPRGYIVQPFLSPKEPNKVKIQVFVHFPKTFFYATIKLGLQAHQRYLQVYVNHGPSGLYFRAYFDPEMGQNMSDFYNISERPLDQFSRFGSHMKKKNELKIVPKIWGQYLFQDICRQTLGWFSGLKSHKKVLGS